jgi:hypothetical protein
MVGGGGAGWEAACGREGGRGGVRSRGDGGDADEGRGEGGDGSAAADGGGWSRGI